MECEETIPDLLIGGGVVIVGFAVLIITLILCKKRKRLVQEEEGFWKVKVDRFTENGWKTKKVTSSSSGFSHYSWYHRGDSKTGCSDERQCAQVYTRLVISGGQRFHSEKLATEIIMRSMVDIVCSDDFIFSERDLSRELELGSSDFSFR